MGANAFETGARKCIPAVLLYARAGGRILMIHRNADRPGDYHSGKWNGLGGKLEPDESPAQAARREFHEEAGVDPGEGRFRALGTLTFPNFKAHKSEDWLVFVFVADLSAEEAAKVQARGDEGELHWVPEGDLLSLNLWPGDRHFIPRVLARTPFQGTIWYAGAEVLRAEIANLLS